MEFIAQLKRRNVFKVGIAYLALAWVSVQIMDTVVPAFDMPGWVLKFVIWLGAIGFPFMPLFPGLRTHTRGPEARERGRPHAFDHARHR
jgi:hypothetical protein